MQISTFVPNDSIDKYAIAQDYKYIGSDLWNWWIWIDATDENLDKITSVIYNLHYTFIDPIRIIKTRENQFKLEASGWGTFTIYASIKFKDTTILDLEHELVLEYPDGESPSE